MAALSYNGPSPFRSMIRSSLWL